MSTSAQIPTPDAREQRIGQVLNEYLDRRARGEPISVARVLAEHPDLAHDLRAHLDLLRDLRPGGGRIEDLINQGLLTHAVDPRYAAEFGPYRILGLIGRGGMGIVLKAYEEDLDRLIALKLLRPELADDTTMLARFEREAKAAAALRHPNIVTVHAIGHQRGAPYMAMEFVDGISLAEAIRADGPLPPDMVRRILREVLTGLDVAHNAGLVHRDIKPSNILLDLRTTQAPKTPEVTGCATEDACRLDPVLARATAPVVKIADFGLARVRAAGTQLTLTECALGTPAYMSPEQAQGTQHVDQRSDLYSVGVVLYEMLTGRAPFGADTSAATIHRILYDAPPDPSELHKNVDPSLASLAIRLMAKLPEHRLPTAADTLAALDAGQQVHSPEQRRRKWQRLLRVALPAVLLALLVAIMLPLARRSSTPATAPRRVREVRIDPDAPRTILARYDDNATWQVFRNDFPPEVDQVGPVQLVRLRGTDQTAVVVGLNARQAAANLVAYNEQTTEPTWIADLCRPWPGSDPGEPWHVRYVELVDLNAGRGEELLVVATLSKSFPSRLSRVDPVSGAVRATFWHMGHVGQPRIAPGLLEAGRPAVVATCLNNKLDEYPVTAGEEPRTPFDIVSALCVLDPDAMDGLGPPLVTDVPDLPRAQPYAYGFLNLPPSEQGTYVPAGETRRVSPAPEMCARIAELLIPSRAPSADAVPNLILGIGRSGAGGATLTLTGNLELVRAIPSSGETEGPSAEYWREQWIPVYQQAQAVPPRSTTARPHQTGAANATATTSPSSSLTAVWPDTRKRTVVLARRGISDPPAVFHEFPAAAGAVADVVLVNPDGRGPSIVVVGLDRPVDGCAIYAFDKGGAEIRRIDLSSDHQWPDCAPPAKWKCTVLLAANLDGEPGDELVAVVRDCYEYGTRLSIIDPRTWGVRSTFWHLGALTAVTPVPDFFGPGRAALTAVGLNNKLDGFAEPADGDDPSRTQHDVVSVAIVLDPREMDGVGPPRTRRLSDLPLARPYAYAFLDLPACVLGASASAASGVPAAPQPSAPMCIRELSPAPYAATDDTGPWLMVHLEPAAGQPNPGYLIADRHLVARQFVVPSGATTDAATEYWKSYWHRIIDQGKYLGE